MNSRIEFDTPRRHLVLRCTVSVSFLRCGTLPKSVRDRSPQTRTICREGQRVTSVDVLPGNAEQNRKTKLLISAGTVLYNVSVSPSSGCALSVRVKFDGDQRVLSFPAFHKVFFYGDHKQHLVEFCQWSNLEAQVV